MDVSFLGVSSPLIRGHMDMETPENPSTEDKYLAWDALGIGSCTEPPLPVSGFEVRRAAHGQIPAIHQLLWVSLGLWNKGLCLMPTQPCCVALSMPAAGEATGSWTVKFCPPS